MPEARTTLILPSGKDGLAIKMVVSGGRFGEDNLAILVRKRPQANEGMGEEGMTFPNIAAGGREGAEARVVLATECSGLPFATCTLMVQALEL
jgi:hypothetical protein